MIERLADIEGLKLAAGEEFNFACRPDLACFGACCRDKRLPVLPYDLLRLRRALGLGSAQALEEYTLLEEDPGSGWPVFRLQLREDGTCPFLGEKGCGVYADRPACCRVYPLARAVGRGGSEVYLRQETTGCLGWEETNPLTPAGWAEDQDLAPYNRWNDRLAELILHPRRRGRVRLTPPQTHAFIAALYNLEAFRALVEEKSFGARYKFKKAEIAPALEDEEKLLDLGQEWLTRQLFG